MCFGDDDALSEDQLPPEALRYLAPYLERLRQFREACAPHLERLATLGIRVSQTIPGHPADGYDAFYQPRGGSPMIRFQRNLRSAYAWPAGDGWWKLRRWMKRERHSDSQITDCRSFDAVLNYVMSVGPAESGPPPRA